MTQEAMTYLTEVLDYIQANSVKREQINWQALRKEVLELAKEAQTSAETYPAIEFALKHLDDNHSFFWSPEKGRQRLTGITKRIGLRATYPEGFVIVVFSGSPAEQAGIQRGDRIVRCNGQPLLALTREQFFEALREEQIDLLLQFNGKQSSHAVHLQAALYNERRMPKGRRLLQNIGYLDLPDLLDSPEHNQQYMAEAQRLLRQIDEDPVCGWVIDLRCNFGGNMWPMIVGLGSILGEGEWLAFTSPWKNVVAFYREGKAGTDAVGVLAEIEEPYQVKRAWPSVAILTSQATVSSGEFIALAFRGRPHTRSFGEPTYGLPTSNYSKVLRDGALLVLTTRLGVDRVGQVFDRPIPANYHVKVDWTCLGMSDDPVLQAALEWLQMEESSRED